MHHSILSPKIFGTFAPTAKDPSMLACMTWWISLPHQGVYLPRSTHPVLSTVTLANPADSAASGSQPPSSQRTPPTFTTTQSSPSKESSSDAERTQSDASSDSSGSSSESSSDSTDPKNSPVAVSENVSLNPQTFLLVRMIPSPVRGDIVSSHAEGEHGKASEGGARGDASDIDDEEGFFDMPYHAALIAVLYPGQPFPVENLSTSAPGGSSIPSADHLSADVSDDDVPLVFKRKRRTESSSVPETSKRQKTSSQVLKLAKEWCMSPAQVEEIAVEHNLVMTNWIICSKDAKMAKQVVQEEGGISQHQDLLSHFDSMTMEQRKVASKAESANRKN
ncbi:hypothetical protein L2E82_17094 [Cichorium intybus]|uniref:Uncharacterized protein n=1 Tax=Cichorium intybus TaxID=13427 RepID=A0ACB9F8A4_CICIN|nr:hypothetical protein L2E82_17094 [Cichorium intybus]